MVKHILFCSTYELDSQDIERKSGFVWYLSSTSAKIHSSLQKIYTKSEPGLHLQKENLLGGLKAHIRIAHIGIVQHNSRLEACLTSMATLSCLEGTA